MSVKVEIFGFMPDGREAKLILRFKSRKGLNIGSKRLRREF